MTFKFIHFGCWNNGLCDTTTTTNGLSQTMKLLNDTILEDTYNFISVAGDNYYMKKYEQASDEKPEKVKEEKPEKVKDGKKEKKVKDPKIFNIENFTSGFDCLPNNPPKYVIYGNHDIDDKVNEGEAIIQCKLIEEQLKYKQANPMKNIILFEDVMTLYNNKTLIIFIDTTLYDNEKQEEYITNTCYKQINSTYRIFKNVLETGKIKDLVEYQNNKIFEIIANTIRDQPMFSNLIIIGHEPITSIKSKEGKDKATSLELLINCFKQVVEIIRSKNINVYYLCADTHLYQHGTVKINDYMINMYVVGTGGTTLDNCSISNNKTFGDVEYTIIEQKKTHGFITVECDDTVKINFVDINRNPVSAASAAAHFNKYIKYKNKYLNLRNKKIELL